MAAIANVLLAGVILAILFWIRPRLRGTTLMAAWYWSAVAIVAAAAIEIVIAAFGEASSPAWAAPLRYAAAVSTFCTIMAVLGAKRPQDRAWQWVVLAMWATLCMPSVQWLAIGQGEPFAIHAAWKLFVFGLMGVTLLNYIPIRPRSVVIVAILGQWILLRPFLVEGIDRLGVWRVPTLLFLFALAAIGASVNMTTIARGCRLLKPDDPLARLNIRWRSFRDMYGAFWALRVEQRVNQTAESGNWPVRLAWDGLTSTDGKESPELTDAQIGEIERCLQSLLSRFMGESIL